jgi:hypothetical protein
MNGTDYCALWHAAEGWLLKGTAVGAENIHRYESDAGFSAEIMVDDLGLVTAYPRGWEGIAAF